MRGGPVSIPAVVSRKPAASPAAECQAAIGVDEHGFKPLSAEIEGESREELRGRIVSRRNRTGRIRLKMMSMSGVVMPACATTGVNTFPGGSVSGSFDSVGPL